MSTTTNNRATTLKKYEPHLDELLTDDAQRERVRELILEADSIEEMFEDFRRFGVRKTLYFLQCFARKLNLAEANAWVPLNGPDDLPKDNSNKLVSVDGHNGNSWTEEAHYRDRHWWPERSDSYGEPAMLCEDGQVTAWREMPQPYKQEKTK